MFPNDAITFHDELNGVVSIEITDEPSTVFSVSMQQSANNSTTRLQCDGDDIAMNYAKDLNNVLLNYQCDGTLSVSKTGQDTSSIIVTYVPYLTSEYRPHYEPSYNIGTSTDVHVYGNVTSGEILIATLVFFLIFIELLKSITRALDKIKTKKTYLGYSGGDVEIRDDI